MSAPSITAAASRATDAECVAASLEDPACFGELFDRHHLAVFRYVRSRLGDDADDAVGDTFIEAFRHRARFDPSHGTSALPWLLGIATNVIGRRREAERRWLRRSPLTTGPEADATEDADARLDSLQLGPQLAAALAGLRRRDRIALLLHVTGDLSIEQVAQALDVPPGTIKSRLHRARRVLAARLEVHR
jgi:RNA polymerase sigma-70 factor (ECF subfamily)